MDEKEQIARILARQLEGIMFHSDLATIYAVLGDKKCCKFHKCQAIDETKAFLYTTTTIAEHYGEVIEPAQSDRIIISAAPVTNDFTDEETKELKEKIATEWQAWEKETLAIYQDMARTGTISRIWAHLANLVATEIRRLERAEKQTTK